MKRVLIISPHFPPINAPDMQRVRMSLPYYKELGWEPVVLCVNEKYVSGFRDELLNESLPADIEIHKVKAWPEKITRKLGVGSSLTLRSYYHFKKKGNELLSQRKFDLVFFSTSLFHVVALGKYWKEKFGLPFVVDMQDPWRNDFYLGKPKPINPTKFRISYTIDKKMEAHTMPHADGIISVSQAYIDTLRDRYPALKNKPAIVLPFGTSIKDFEVVDQKKIEPTIIKKNSGKINVVYVGAITKMFLPLIKSFFKAFSQSVEEKDKYHFYFIGSNYAVGITGRPLEQLAAESGLGYQVTEVPDRIPYFSALATLLYADILFIPGSLDPDYNASKVYNNIFTGKPIFSIFNEKSLVKKIIEETNAGIVVGINEKDAESVIVQKIKNVMPDFVQLHRNESKTNLEKLQQHTAYAMTQKQVNFFNGICEMHSK